MNQIDEIDQRDKTNQMNQTNQARPVSSAQLSLRVLAKIMCLDTLTQQNGS